MMATITKTPTQSDLSEALGISTRRLRAMFGCGCPRGPLEAIQRWRDQNLSGGKRQGWQTKLERAAESQPKPEYCECVGPEVVAELVESLIVGALADLLDPLSDDEFCDRCRVLSEFVLTDLLRYMPSDCHRADGDDGGYFDPAIQRMGFMPLVERDRRRAAEASDTVTAADARKRDRSIAAESEKAEKRLAKLKGLPQ